MDSNYYIDQGSQINEKLNEGIKVLEEDLRKKIEDIQNELIKTNDSTAESHIDKCTDMQNKIQEDLIVKINEEIKIVTANAEKWQGWYNDMHSIQDNDGYEGAISKGMPAWKESEEIEERELVIPGPKAGNIDYGTYKTVTKTISVYYWTAYLGVFVDSKGYISFWITNYMKKNGVESNMGTNLATIANEADYITYYVNRGSIGGKG